MIETLTSIESALNVIRNVDVCFSDKYTHAKLSGPVTAELDYSNEQMRELLEWAKETICEPFTYRIGVISGEGIERITEINIPINNTMINFKKKED